MPNPRSPRAGQGRADKFKVVGHVTKLPPPCRITIPGVGEFPVDILSQEEFGRLGPEDEPEEFTPLRLGLMGRVRVDEVKRVDGPKKPWWAD